MLKKIPSILMTALLLLVIVAVPVAAIEDETQTEETTTTSTENETEKEPELTREQRFEKRKAEFKDKLFSGAKELRLKNRCKAAQGLVKGPQARAKSIKISRDKVYGNMQTRLDSMVEKLKTKGVDTTTLESQITELKSLITKFNEDLATYTLAVDDLVAMDCEADPDAFKAALEEARTLRGGLKDSGAAIRAYVKETIKPTLVEIRKQLGGDDESETETQPTETETGGEQ